MSGADPDAHLILFDCDGTLTDSHGAIVHAMQQAFVACSVEPPSGEAVRGVIGLSLIAAVEALLPEEKSLHDRIARLYRDSYVAAESSLKLYPGVTDTLAELMSRGYRMGIVTGKSTRGLLRVLEQFSLENYFEVFRTADCCRSKPDPQMALECMDELGFVSGQTSLVGDALFDMQMASAAEIRAYGVSFGAEAADALYVAGAYSVVDDFPALLEHFPSLNPDALQATISS